MADLKEKLEKAQIKEKLPLEYLGIPLVGKAPVEYMSSTHTPAYQMTDGSVIYGYVRGKEDHDKNAVYKDRTDVMDDIVISTQDSYKTHSIEESTNKEARSFYSDYLRSDIQSAGITYGKKQEDLGNPVFFSLTDLSEASLTTKRNSQNNDKESYISKNSLDTMTFFAKNQDDLTKLQQFCLVNMGQAMTAENESVYRRRRFLEGLKNLYGLLSKPDARLDSLPGNSTRKILTEEELKNFFQQIDKKFDAKFAKKSHDKKPISNKLINEGR